MTDSILFSVKVVFDNSIQNLASSSDSKGGGGCGSGCGCGSGGGGH
jgi:uncharacterized membrane protein